MIVSRNVLPRIVIYCPNMNRCLVNSDNNGDNLLNIEIDKMLICKVSICSYWSIILQCVSL